jgi:hypothetical protein
MAGQIARGTESMAQAGANQAGPTQAASTQTVAQKVARTSAQAAEVQRRVNRGGRKLGESVWNPFVRLSGVLWLEVMGVFFGVFMLLALQGVWRLRGAWHGSDQPRLLGAAAMALLFGYFCISSFVKAHLRGKRR